MIDNFHRSLQWQWRISSASPPISIRERYVASFDRRRLQADDLRTAVSSASNAQLTGSRYAGSRRASAAAIANQAAGVLVRQATAMQSARTKLGPSPFVMALDKDGRIRAEQVR